MSLFEYVAKREIKSGHVPDDTYFLEIPMGLIVPQMVPLKDVARPVQGPDFVTLHGLSRTYSFNTVPVLEEIDDIEEFLASVIAGETFNVNVDGSTPLTGCQLDGSYSRSQVNSVGYYSYSFKIKVNS